MCQTESGPIATATVKAHYQALRKALRCIERVSRRISDVVEQAEDMIVSSAYHEGIQLLPTEVLCMIFELVVSGSDESRGETAVSLSHVNRRWRDITVDLPRLWTDVRLLGSLDRVRTFLDRSNTALIDITLNPPANDDESFDAIGERVELRKASDLIMAHGHRWRSLSWPLTTMVHLSDFNPKKYLKIETPHLEEITVSGAWDISLPLPQSLRTLNLGYGPGSDNAFDLLDSKDAFSQLTNLSCNISCSTQQTPFPCMTLSNA